MNNKIDICTIRAAKNGDADSMELILKHYIPMINRMSARTFVDKEGRSYRVVDNSIKERIVSKLMFQIVYKYEIGGKSGANDCFEW